MRIRKVFISYSRADAAFVARLRANLSKLPLQPWQDIHDLVGGGDWLHDIDAALRASSIVLVVLSKASVRSDYVNYEWAFALGAGAIVVPIIREPVPFHMRLSRVQAVDFTKPGKNWLRLADVLDHHLQGRGPRIRAAFELENRVPIRIGPEFRIQLSIEGAPKRAQSATFHLHDPSFRVSTWTERNADEEFEAWMQSYGDVPISATLSSGSSTRPTLVTTSLFSALNRTHRLSRNPAILKALKYIEEH
jgi:hypothetical protein